MQCNCCLHNFDSPVRLLPKRVPVDLEPVAEDSEAVFHNATSPGESGKRNNNLASLMTLHTVLLKVQACSFKNLQ